MCVISRLTYFLGVHDTTLADADVAHGYKGVIGRAKGLGELILSQRLASIVPFILLKLPLNLREGREEGGGGEGRGGVRYV